MQILGENKIQARPIISRFRSSDLLAFSAANLAAGTI